MVANGLNVLLGLWLVYVAVLDPTFVNDVTWRLVAMAVAVIVLAGIAVRTEYLKWVSVTNVVIGIVLIILAGLRSQVLAPDLLMFWGVFWSGIVVSVLAFWSILYRPRAPFNLPANDKR